MWFSYCFCVFSRSLVKKVKKHFLGKRTLVTSIFSTVKSLAWALLLLVLIVYLDEITWRQLTGKRVDSIQEQALFVLCFGCNHVLVADICVMCIHGNGNIYYTMLLWLIMSDRSPKTNRMSIYEKCREQGHEHIHNVCPTMMRYVFAVIFVQDSWLYIKMNWMNWLMSQQDGLQLQTKELGNNDQVVLVIGLISTP